MQTDPRALVRNHLKEKLARDELTVSMIVRISHGTEIARIAQYNGFDALYVDLEHSVLSLETASRICIAAQDAGVTPLVRVASGNASMMSRALDGGAMGIIVPHVTCAADAQQAAALARHPPLGCRAVASGLPQLHYQDYPQHLVNQALNDATLVVAMIESADALENLDEIAGVDGVDMLFIGAGDLSTELGIAGQMEHPLMSAAIARVIAACRAHGKVAGLGGLAGKPELLRQCVQQGARFVSAGTDLAFLASGAAARAKVVKSLAEEPPASGR